MSWKVLLLSLFTLSLQTTSFSKGSTVSLEFRLVTKAPAGQEWNIEGSSEKVFLSEPFLTTNDVASAKLANPSCTKLCTIDLELKEKGAKALAQTTRMHVGERIGILVDGALVSMPTIKAEITSARTQISGDFDRASANSIIKSITQRR